MLGPVRFSRVEVLRLHLSMGTECEAARKEGVQKAIAITGAGHCSGVSEPLMVRQQLW